ncbi:MAG: formate dehydrogenase accessory protein FdhE [Rubrivivax sp.]|nr:formate dehydrogenase accessory protein FdhE [Rubrivivax sp.]
MSASATVRVMSPEEIAARAGGETPFLRLPERGTVFAERAMRLRQLARGHAMADYLDFVANLAQAQQRLLDGLAAAAGPAAPALPDADALDRAARAGLPPLPAADGPDAAWRGLLRALLADLQRGAPAATQAVLQRLAGADDAFLDRQADALLGGHADGLDLAAAPLVGAALQVLWTHQVCAVQAQATAHQPSRGAPFGRTDDERACPCCGSRPTASITRSAGESLGQRYLHCSLCSTQWHLVRIKCSHCGSDKHLAYQSLEAADAEPAEGAGSRAAQAAVQAETCDDCGHYLKIVHSDRDPFVDPVADDLASLTLDLLVAETGQRRHGVNLMLLFGEGAAELPPDTGPGG